MDHLACLHVPEFEAAQTAGSSQLLLAPRPGDAVFCLVKGLEFLERTDRPDLHGLVFEGESAAYPCKSGAAGAEGKAGDRNGAKRGPGLAGGGIPDDEPIITAGSQAFAVRAVGQGPNPAIVSSKGEQHLPGAG